MSKRIQIRVWVDEETEEYIKDYQYKNKIKTLGQSIDYLVEKCKREDGQKHSILYIAETVSKNISEKLSQSIQSELNKIRLGTNNADRNTQVLIELMNGHLDQLGYEHFLTTDLQESMPLEISKQVVNERISKRKQKNHSSDI